jgi:hypothetical protein
MLNEQKLSREIVSALAILTQSEFPILHIGGEFIDGNGSKFKLAAEEFQRVLKHDTLAHPITKSEVVKASHHVWPVFMIDKNAMGGRG